MHRVLTLTALSLALALGSQACAATTGGSEAAAKPPKAYVEFAVPNLARAKAFYGAVFGWNFTDYGAEYSSFEGLGTSGGFLHAQASGTGGPLAVFPVTDLNAALARVKAAGGTVTRPIFSYPGGQRFHFRDLDGYEIAAALEP
jgi:predicted enzyme related to lactoylglutathione lyase